MKDSMIDVVRTLAEESSYGQSSLEAALSICRRGSSLDNARFLARMRWLLTSYAAGSAPIIRGKNLDASKIASHLLHPKGAVLNYIQASGCLLDRRSLERVFLAVGHHCCPK